MDEKTKAKIEELLKSEDIDLEAYLKEHEGGNDE